MPHIKMNSNTVEFTNIFFPVREHTTGSLHLLPVPPTRVQKSKLKEFMSACTIDDFLGSLAVSTDYGAPHESGQCEVSFTEHLDQLLCRTCSPHSDEHGGLCLIVKVRTVTRLALFCSNIQDKNYLEPVRFLVALISLTKTLIYTETCNTINMHQLLTVGHQCLGSLKNVKWKNVINLAFLKVHKVRQARQMVIGISLDEQTYTVPGKEICSNHLPSMSFTLTEQSASITGRTGDVFRYRKKHPTENTEQTCVKTCLNGHSIAHFVTILDIEAALALMWKQNVHTRYGEGENRGLQDTLQSEWYRSVLFCRHYASTCGK